uniref:ATP synthase complex subunit 8 n=1 Tax=Farynala dextra TaxID=2893145 RepID=A0A9E6XTK7_9HEMI|nr:ATP synthase F0 subunit 8 [Farynala dextra]UGN61514.1 ATP synthase F0 subunit 8 [Farynala dextra]
MPQMSPMWWTSLMIMFIISIFVCMYIMYFNYSKNMSTKSKKEYKNMSWTW